MEDGFIKTVRTYKYKHKAESALVFLKKADSSGRYEFKTEEIDYDDKE